MNTTNKQKKTIKINTSKRSNFIYIQDKNNLLIRIHIYRTENYKGLSFDIYEPQTREIEVTTFKEDSNEIDHKIL